MCNGSLLEAIAITTNPLGWATRLTILHGVSKGINFLHTGHEKPLVHRDIKSANILLNEQYVAKVRYNTKPLLVFITICATL